MKLAIITQPAFFVEEDKIISALFDEGLDNLHLMKPDSSPIYLERLLSLTPDDYRRRITTHQHYYLKSEYSLSGIHVDGATTPLPDGYKGHFSRTCYSLPETKSARKKAEYVFLDCGNREDTLAYTVDDRRVYAMDMRLEDIQRCRELGFGGVVIGSDLWSRFDMHSHRDFHELLAHFRKLRKAAG